MDFTPNDEASSHDLSSFGHSARVFESTPKSETEITSHVYNSNPKKRKVQYCDIRGRKLDDLLELCPLTPQASSTLNESLTKEFENITIEKSFFTVDDYDGRAPKFLKSNGCEKLVTPPSTPESHLKAFDRTPKKSSSFQKCASALNVPSPLKEQHEILYPTLKPLEPMRKPLTPQKFKEKLEKIGQNSTPVRRYRSYFEDGSKNRKLLNAVLRNDVVMKEVFKYLSGKDLLRVSTVSREFWDALRRNTKASDKYEEYKELQKKNKENYKITPPSSPESQSLFPEGSVSPNSENFANFVETGICLNQGQSLIKCPKCCKPSVVEKAIAQCQQVNACGFIFCQKCDSFAYNPAEFYDKCQGLVLGNTAAKKRPTLEDLTNCSLEFNVSSILNSTTDNHYQSSGYFSGYETSHTPQSVKRNLSASFGVNENLLISQRVLFDSNRSLNVSSINIKNGKRKDKHRSSGSIIPVVMRETAKRGIENIEPSSPPRVKTYPACSKESKRSLKRLTR